MSRTEFLVSLQDQAVRNIVGNPTLISGTGPGGSGTAPITEGWNNTYKRMLREIDLTATGPSHFQRFDGIVPYRKADAMMPPNPPTDMIYRVRETVGAQYVSGAGVSRVGWGHTIGWSNNFPGAPPAGNLDPGFIGFLWYQVGATVANWRCKAAANDGTFLFDFDTGLPGDGVIYTLRIDIDNRLGQRNIKYYVDEALVATFTPASGVLGGIDTSDPRFGIGINCQQGNRALALHGMLGQQGHEYFVQTGPTEVSA